AGIGEERSGLRQSAVSTDDLSFGHPVSAAEVDGVACDYFARPSLEPVRASVDRGALFRDGRRACIGAGGGNGGGYVDGCAPDRAPRLGGTFMTPTILSEDATAQAVESQSTYHYSLGYLRAFLVVLVVAHHSALAYYPFAPPMTGSLAAQPRWWQA